MSLEIRVKICGITSPEDARAAHDLGADFLGVVFADGPRRVSVADARRIRDAVPDALIVGVFADARAKEVVSCCRSCGVDLVQLHGGESPTFCDEVQRELGLPVIKSKTAEEPSGADELRRFTRTSYFLFDLPKTNGSPTLEAERPRDLARLWERAALARRTGYRVFLAGALDLRNVREALRAVVPYAIDVSRAVEKAPGVKDRARLREFMEGVKG
jgi:phosphoribosylanthranilate isomerase